MNLETGEAEAVTSEDLAAREAYASEPAPVKPAPRKRTDGPEN